MGGQTLSTEALVLDKRAPTESFQGFTVFSADHGPLMILQRVVRKPSAGQVSLDLFDEASFLLETSNQGHSWFVKEVRMLSRKPGIGRGYETLRHACLLAQLVLRNPAAEDGRGRVYALVQTALEAFSTSNRPDIVYFKSSYRFARDEGYPLKQQWLPTLTARDQSTATALLTRPVAELETPASHVEQLQHRLQDYLRSHTEIVVD